MQKTVRKPLAFLVAALLLLGMIPIFGITANAVDNMNLTSPGSNRLGDTVNAFADDPYNKSVNNLWQKNASVEYIQKNGVANTKYYLNTGKSATEFVEAKTKSRNIKFDLTVSATFYGITAKVGYGLNYKTATSSNTEQYTDSFFFNYETRVVRNNKRLADVSANDLSVLRGKLNAQAEKDLYEMDPLTFLESYGTHIVLGYDAGGTFDLNASAFSTSTKEVTTQTDDMTHSIPISVGAIAKVVDVDTKTTIQDISTLEQTWKSENTDYTLNGKKVGGSVSIKVGDLTSPANVSALTKTVEDWENALGKSDTDHNIVANENLELVSIWELLPASEVQRKAALMRAYYSKAESINDAFFKNAAFYNRTAKFPNAISTSFADGAISTVDQLKAIAGSEGDYYLVNDIDLANAAWTPINFGGTLDGRGFAIKNLNASDASAAGLFNRLRGATIENLTVQGKVFGNEKAGGFAAYAQDSTINNCVSNVYVSNIGDYNASTLPGRGISPRIGGFVGEMSGGSVIKNSVNKGTISYSGRIANDNNAYWYQLYDGKTRSVEYFDTYSAGVGGITGGVKDSTTSLAITNCMNEGGNVAAAFKRYERSLGTTKRKDSDLITAAYAGGIVGLVDNGNAKIQYNVNNGPLGTLTAAGGLVGFAINSGNGLSILDNHVAGKLDHHQPVYGAKQSATAPAVTGNTYNSNATELKPAQISNASGLTSAQSNAKVAAYKAQAKPIARVAITANSPARTKTYYEYDSVDFADVLVDVVYSDGSTAAGLKSGFAVIYNFDPEDSKFRKQLAVNYDGCTDIIDVKVEKPGVDSISVFGAESKEYGEAFGADDVIVIQTFVNDNVEVLDPAKANITTTNYNPNKEGAQSVNVLLNGQKVGAVNVNVGKAPVVVEPTPEPEPTPTPTVEYIKVFGKTTKYPKNFLNYILLIVCFGWIWMPLIK